MTIRIQKSFGKAFGYFLRALRFHELNFLLEDFSLPKTLKKNGYRIPVEIKEIRGIPSFFLFLFSFLVFSFLWIRFGKDVHNIFSWLKNEREMLEDIAKKIPDFSKVQWNQHVVRIYPVIGGWAGSRHGEVYIGIKPEDEFLKKRPIDVVIHELIHINASEKGRERTEHIIQNWDLADELAAVVLTRKIQRDILGASDSQLQPLPIPLRDFGVEKHLNELEKIAGYASFASLLIHCSHIISKK